MNEYSLKRESLKILLKKIIPTSLLSLLLPIILYFILKSSLIGSPINGLLTLFFLFLFLYNLIKESIKIYRTRRDWLSFKIIISNDSIMKHQRNIPEVIISIDQIERVAQVTGGVSIQTDDPQKFIFVPSDIENYEELTSNLNTYRPIEVSPITSVRMSPEYTLKQHIKPGTALKKLFIGIGIGFGVLLSFFLLIIGLIYFLTH